MFAIFKRELKTYFTSVIGYVCLTVFTILAGFFFVFINVNSGSSDFSQLFSNLIFICMFLVPIMTMRVFSEEKRQKTDQLLLTSPVSLTGIVLGKFFAVFVFYGVAFSVTILDAIVLSFFGGLDGLVILCQFLGILFIGMAYLAIGVFISNTTENQIVAVILTFVVLLLLNLVNAVTSLTTNTVVTSIANFISTSARSENFFKGIFNASDVMYFVSLTVLFLFLTGRSIESRRWN